MLLDPDTAERFLTDYKAVMAFVNDGVCPKGGEAFTAVRPLIYNNFDRIADGLAGVVGAEFVESLQSAVFEKFFYLKKYQHGYVFQSANTGLYYQAAAMTTPLEEIMPDYSIIETGIISYGGGLVCDGLIVSYNTTIGNTMAKTIRDGYWQARRSGELITEIHNERV